MTLYYESEYHLRTSDFDCRTQLSPAAILDLFQSAAGSHVEELGIGFQAMLERQLMWVAVKVKLQIIASPRLYSKVKVKTWPLPPSKISFQRDYLIEDEAGNVLVRGTSEWVMMHSGRRRIVPAQDLYPPGENFYTERAFSDKLQRINCEVDDGTAYPVAISFSTLDMNGHVNNTKYANFVLDALNPAPDELIDTMQMDYHHEVKNGTELSIVSQRNDKEILAEGHDSSGECMFSCRILLK